MTNPEQIQQESTDSKTKPEAPSFEIFGEKFLSEVYGNTQASATDATDKGRAPKMKTENNSSAALEKEGNVESLKLPSGFSKASHDKRENFVQFNSDTNKDTKVCYQRRSDFSADDEDTQRINDVLKKAPHKLDEQETLDVMPMMMPGRPWGTGNYTDLSLRSADIDGRRVLVADFKFNDQDKRVHLIMANQESSKHQIENIWIEGPSKDFEKANKSALDSLEQIKWSKKS
ncbi:MAG: hypothetical protein K2X27_17260 [Candidatus Obscuribacterales bacterium]|nr:hypothetical protein [Candidatus Obscuribacterales bacterium]